MINRGRGGDEAKRKGSAWLGGVATEGANVFPRATFSAAWQGRRDATHAGATGWTQLHSSSGTHPRKCRSRRRTPCKISWSRGIDPCWSAAVGPKQGEAGDSRGLAIGAHGEILVFGRYAHPCDILCGSPFESKWCRSLSPQRPHQARCSSLLGRTDTMKRGRLSLPRSRDKARERDRERENMLHQETRDLAAGGDGASGGKIGARVSDVVMCC